MIDPVYSCGHNSEEPAAIKNTGTDKRVTDGKEVVREMRETITAKGKVFMSRKLRNYNLKLNKHGIIIDCNV